MLGTNFNLSNNAIAAQRQTAPQTTAAQASPPATAPAPADTATISAEANSQERPSESFSSLLQGIDAWDTPEEGPAAAAPAKQSNQSKGWAQLARRGYDAYQRVDQRTRNARNGSQVVRGARNGANAENDTCQQIGGWVSAGSGALGYVPHPVAQVASKIGGGIGLALSFGCPTPRSAEEVAELRRQQREINERVSRQPAAFPGAPRWNPNVSGAGR